MWYDLDMNKLETIEFLKTSMPGYRNDGVTPNWKHPVDVANIFEEMINQVGFEISPPYNYEDFILTALLHDIYEDGVDENNQRITNYTLSNLGINKYVINSVYYLTKADSTHFGNFGLIDYFFDLGENGTLAATVIKCCDRIANLRDAVHTFKPHRLARYKWETKIMVIPLAKLVGEANKAWGDWLTKELTELSVVETETAKYKNQPEILVKSGVKRENRFHSGKDKKSSTSAQSARQ